MMKRTLALILAAIMLMATVSCKKDDKKPDSGKSTDNGTETAAETGGENDYAEIDSYVAELAKSHQFDGADFSIIGTGENCIYPTEENITGNLQNDAMYSRALELEDKFGIDITFSESTANGYENTGAETSAKVRLDVSSGGNSYDLIEGHVSTCGQVLLNAGCLRSVNESDILDFSKSWWLNNLEGQYSIANQLYFLTGKINPSHYSDASCILYNKEVAANFNLPDMYELVDSGEWTFDKMTEIASAISGGDIRRYMIGSGTSLYFGAGYTISEKDEDDNPVIPKTLSASEINYIDKLSAVFSDRSMIYDKNLNNKNLDDFYDREVFENGQVLFWFDATWRANDMREYDVEFGILPIPKESRDQANYISLSGDRAVYFSKNLKDPEMTEVITEAMAALSEKYLEPAFYEKALKGRSTYDTDSRRVLDILYNSKAIDLALVYNWGELSEVISDATVGYNDSYVSSYNSSARLANNQIKSLLKTVNANK